MNADFLTMITVSCISAPLLCSAVTRSRDSFDQDWSFARFGLQADGTRIQEPGGDPAWSILLTASTEEAVVGREHPACNAMDNDPATRWCAADNNPDQWLMLDLGKQTGLKEVSVDWDLTAAWTEKKLPYGFVIEGSVDGNDWKMMADHRKSENTNPSHCTVVGTPRFLRVRTTTVGGSQWASIREIKLTGADGAPIANRRQTAGESPAAPHFNDQSWRKLAVPHDWGIEGPFRIELAGETGKLPWKGIGWYRKHFTVPAEDQGSQVFIDFDGAMAHAKVYCNGAFVGTWPYGYNSFRMNLTPFLRFGADNVIAVRLDTEKWDSRWYPGAGIYRHVWLVKTQPVHVSHWGTYVTTPEITADKGVVKIAVTLDNATDESATVTVETAVFEMMQSGRIPNRPPCASPTPLVVPAHGSATTIQQIDVPEPELWSLETPHRYIARTIVKSGDQVVDSYDTPFGFRTLKFTARDGFLLNGKRVEIRGTCNHHDLGALGAAMNERALERQLEILKAMGCNSLRTSHNPPAPELLDLADRMGFLVWDEAFDCWARGKKASDYSKLYAQWHQKDLEAMVRRDRNHPSVFIWSIGNEVMEQQNSAMTRHLADIVRATDPTRPVSNGYNNPDGGRASGAVKGLDLMGVNYFFSQQDKWDNDPRYMNMPTLGSETSSCVSSRGEYFFGTNRANWQITSYDLDRPGWGCTPDDQFRTNARWPHLLGEYVWTGFDYLGEPTPYQSADSNLLNFRNNPSKRAELERELEKMRKSSPPSRSSYFGIIDLAGFPKDRYYCYQAQWRPDLPMAHLLPHWNWPERVGQITPVHLYTSGDEAELFLNGKSLGRKTRKPGVDFRFVWDDVKYQPGELKVVAYKQGKDWATDTVKTTGSPALLALAADRSTIKGDGRDLSFITVRVADKAGLTVPRSCNSIQFTIDGPGEIVAVDNGDATSFESFQATRRKAFNGLALAIVRAKPGSTGPFTVKAAAEGLAPASVVITAG